MEYSIRSLLNQIGTDINEIEMALFHERYEDILHLINSIENCADEIRDEINVNAL